MFQIHRLASAEFASSRTRPGCDSHTLTAIPKTLKHPETTNARRPAIGVLIWNRGEPSSPSAGAPVALAAQKLASRQLQMNKTKDLLA